MWVLILYLHWGSGTAITQVQFKTEAACNQAGKQWEEQVGGLTSQAIYSCIKEGI